MVPLAATKLPVDVHLAFNLFLALLAWPFSRLLARWMTILVPEQMQSGDAPKYLDPAELSTPVVALSSAAREVLGVGDVIEKMLVKASDAFDHNNEIGLREIPALEARVDRLQQEIKVYLSKLGRTGLSEDEGASRSSSSIMPSTSSILVTSSRRAYCRQCGGRLPRG